MLLKRYLDCFVKDLHPGYIVVRLNGDSFETLSADNEADMYVVHI